MLHLGANGALVKAPVSTPHPEDGFPSLYYTPWSVAITTAERSRHSAEFAETWVI